MQTRRRSARILATPATTSTVTPSTTPSPVLSNELAIGSETPETSDVEETKQTGVVQASVVTRNTRKRAADAELGAATKRRVVSPAVFVQIPANNNIATSKVTSFWWLAMM